MLPAVLRTIFVLFFFIVFLSFPKLTFAQSTAGVPVTNALYNPEVHTGFTLQNVLGQTVGCMGIGQDISVAPQTTTTQGSTPLRSTCPVKDPNGNLVAYSKLPSGGALGGVNKVMVALYNNPPTSSKEYLADLGTQMGLIPSAYAQQLPTFGVGGSGDRVIAPILNLWKVMRNLAYLIFIVIFVLVGFMIMFRRKINPQTVISVQSALPGLVIGLILVTFSYFLAALIIDLSFVGMKLVAFIFQQSGLNNIISEGSQGFNPNPTQGPTSIATDGNIFGLFWAFIANDSLRANIIAPLSSLFNITPTLDKAFNEATGGGWNIFGIEVNLGAVVGGIVDVVGNGLGALGGVLISVIIIVALLIQMFRLLWGLVSAYITVIIFSIAGPLLIAFGSIPGRGGLISYWWKGLLANVLIFPAVFFVFLFAGIFLFPGNVSSFTHALPLFAGLPFGVLPAIIGYGIVLGSPAVPGLVKQAMGVKDITAIQQAAFGGIAAGFAPFKKGAETAYKPYKTRFEAAREAQLRAFYSEKAGQLAISQAPGLEGWLYRRFYKPRVPFTSGGTQQTSSSSSNP